MCVCVCVCAYIYNYRCTYTHTHTHTHTLNIYVTLCFTNKEIIIIYISLCQKYFYFFQTLTQCLFHVYIYIFQYICIPLFVSYITLVFAGSISLESEWQQMFSNLLDSSELSWSKQYYYRNSFNSSPNFQLFQPPIQDFGDHSKCTS